MLFVHDFRKFFGMDVKKPFVSIIRLVEGDACCDVFFQYQTKRK